MENIWHEIGNKCLEEALKMLNEKTDLTEERVKTVKELVGIAISIDTLNLHWEAQSQFGGQVFRGSAFSQKEARN